MTNSSLKDLRLIEAGFPCHQVGAETQRERGASSALPPLYFLHVWWARRPLTPSRAAVLASLLPADTDPDWFLRQLGIEKRVVEINGQQWTLTGKVLDRVKTDDDGNEFLRVDDKLIGLLEKENEIRRELLEFLIECQADDRLSGVYSETISRWVKEVQPLGIISAEAILPVLKVSADPAWAKEKQELGKAAGYRFPGDPYGYGRAFQNTTSKPISIEKKVVLDPTAGGGSIPFEALRLGHTVIANELNPVACVILHATLEYPARFGISLKNEIEHYGNQLIKALDREVSDCFPDFQSLPVSEGQKLRDLLTKCPEHFDEFNRESIMDYLYCRQVTCPNCGGEAPLLNTCWLSKESGKQWGVRIVPDGRDRNGKVHFETYQISKGRGTKGDDPDFATVNRGTGTCIHCRQAIDADEIKRQARGESPLGKWKDRLYCVVAVRFQPKLDKKGQPQRYASGERAGEIKTEKVRFFRPPNQQDLDALERAEKRLQENWDRWDAEGLIPTENIPEAHKTKEPLRVGMKRWCDMFTPRQLLGHLILVEELNRLKPEIMEELGPEKGRAVVTYLQFAIDKGVDYNGKLTFWDGERGVRHVFSGHDFRINLAFGEMIFCGPASGFSWCLKQIKSAYEDISKLIYSQNTDKNFIKIFNDTAANIRKIESSSVDLICMDPPYYNNVQYAELSDYFYVWMKRTLNDLYPDCFRRRLTNKQDESVANPDRDGGTKNSKIRYEIMMGEIFTECIRVLKDDGLLTLMFTHKTQDAWEALTYSIIENGLNISSCYPITSESSQSMNIKNMAAASSAIFLSCRKRHSNTIEPALWTGFGGTGVASQIRDAVVEGLKEFEALKLNPVDEMVASYGRALRVLSQNWPVLDGDEPVGPIRAMNEASRVVAENQIRRITGGRIKVTDLSPEAAMALTLYGIFGLAEFAYDDALNLSKSLNISLEGKSGGYNADGRFIGINTQATGAGRRVSRTTAEDTGFHAPLVRKGSKLRLARPGERHPKRLEHPQTEWDILHGMIMAYRQGDVPVARGYLKRHAEGNEDFFKALLQVWAAEMRDEMLRKEAQALLFGLR